MTFCLYQELFHIRFVNLEIETFLNISIYKLFILKGLNKNGKFPGKMCENQEKPGKWPEVCMSPD